MPAPQRAIELARTRLPSVAGNRPEVLPERHDQHEETPDGAQGEQQIQAVEKGHREKMTKVLHVNSSLGSLPSVYSNAEAVSLH